FAHLIYAAEFEKIGRHPEWDALGARRNDALSWQFELSAHLVPIPENATAEIKLQAQTDHADALKSYLSAVDQTKALFAQSQAAARLPVVRELVDRLRKQFNLPEGKVELVNDASDPHGLFGLGSANIAVNEKFLEHGLIGPLTEDIVHRLTHVEQQVL